MFNEKVLGSLDLSKATCVKPSENSSLTEDDILDRLQDFPAIEKNTLIIINDQYRSTPSALIINSLRKTGKLNHPVTFIIATGSHVPPEKYEAIKLTGAKNCDNILYHDISKLKNYSYAGKTSRGTEVYYNPALDKYKKIITIGSVEPHYFAGFTGGAKSLVPGIAAKKTIQLNHKWATDPNALQLKTKNNPVFEDIWESANLIRPLDQILTVQVVNHGNMLLHLSTGTIYEAFESARLKSAEFFGKRFDEKFDRIITFVQPPLNKNLYQSQKAINNTKTVLKTGGSLIVVSQCPMGIGNDSFFNKLKELKTPENILKTLNMAHYELGNHLAYNLAKLALNAKLYYVGDLPANTVSALYMKKRTVDELVSSYKKWTADNERILIDEAGGFTAYTSPETK